MTLSTVAFSFKPNNPMMMPEGGGSSGKDKNIDLPVNNNIIQPFSIH